MRLPIAVGPIRVGPRTILIAIAVVAVSINFLIDLLYAVLDPRIRYAK